MTLPHPSRSGPIANILKAFAGRLPGRWQQTLKRIYFSRQIRRGRFQTGEPEYHLLSSWVASGDWVVDVGANIGHYALRLSELVGAQGRVIALEPVPETFELLAANVAGLATRNITLMNLAVSDQACLAGMTIPRGEGGLGNYYQAHLSATAAPLQVLCLPLDALDLPHEVRLVKIDAEGHELSVLRGMSGLLRRDHPILIVEDNSAAIVQFLHQFGYTDQKLPGSPNLVLRKPAAE